MDTVAWWPSTLGGVWAFADNDAWLMGVIVHRDSIGQYKNIIGMHWDGNSWTMPTIPYLGSFIRPVDVTGDDHFMVAAGYAMYPQGYLSSILEFDNNTKKWNGYQYETIGALNSVWTDGKGYFIAVGDNGTVYTKDGYSASWVYSKAPTTFTLYHVTGVSKTEVYVSGYLSLAGGNEYEQYWKCDGKQWDKLFDNQDTTRDAINFPNDYSMMVDVAAYRCPNTDSLQLYFTGWNSYLIQSQGQSLNTYLATNLLSLGLPLQAIGHTAAGIFLFTPNDIWVTSNWYYFYHWNGSNFQQISIPGLPFPGSDAGDIRKMVKTKTGKIFLPAEVSSQIYAVMQGTP